MRFSAPSLFQARPTSIFTTALLLAATTLASGQGVAPSAPAAAEWKIGAPIVTYWAGPGYPGGAPVNDATAAQLVEGGFNLAWCYEAELDTVQKHGLRGLLTNPLLVPATLDHPQQKAELDALIERVRKHPALYAYHLVDEPSAVRFPELKRLIDYLREKDPARLSYINLLPTYANNEQLGTPGGKVEAYNSHLQKYIAETEPRLLSYDHYQFTNSQDNPDYFLNLALVREHALATKLPFMNIVQASSWAPGALASPAGPRVPNADELRYLVHTTLAYGAQAISYYVYCYPGHEGGFALPDGTTTPLYDAVKVLNREFLAIATELQPLKSLGVYHAGHQVPGAVALPQDSAFKFDPAVQDIPYASGERVRGALLGTFGPANAEPGSASGGKQTHAVVVNLDYKTPTRIGITGPGPLDIFDAKAGKWTPAEGPHVNLDLPGGSGALVRLRP